MIRKNNVLTNKRFRNPLENSNSLDNLHALYKIGNVKGDFISHLLNLLLPEFKIMDGHAFITSLFDSEVYERYRSLGRSPSEIQIWMNLVEITEIFENIKVQDARDLANAIVDLWNLKLAREMIADKNHAKIIENMEDGEIFATLDHK